MPKKTQFNQKLKHVYKYTFTNQKGIFVENLYTKKWKRKQLYKIYITINSKKYKLCVIKKKTLLIKRHIQAYIN